MLLILMLYKSLLLGPSFENMLREKQQGNPNMSFLFGGPNADYYHWRIFCVSNNWNEGLTRLFSAPGYAPEHELQHK